MKSVKAEQHSSGDSQRFCAKLLLCALVSVLLYCI